MEETVAARRFFVRRLSQWSAWVIPAAFAIGILGRNFLESKKVRSRVLTLEFHPV